MIIHQISKLFILFSSLMMVLSSCKAGPKQQPNRIKNKDIVYTISYKPYNIDPGLCGTMDGTDIINNTFEGLFRVIEKDHVSFGVVKSYSCSTDRKNYIFDFKNNVYWSDGKKVLPKDFEFAWKRILNRDFLSPQKKLFLPIKNAKQIIDGKKDSSCLGVTALNDYQLKIELEFPIDYLFKLLSLSAFMPTREDIVDEQGAWARDPNKFVCNGPFCLAQYCDDHLLLKKNSFHRQAQKSNINSLCIKIIENPNLAYINYQSGYIDIIDNIPINELHKLQHCSEFKSTPLYGLYYYNFNLNLECFKNPKVRQAFSKAIDKEAIVTKIRKSNEIPANQYIHPDIINETTNKNLDKSSYNVVAAKRLLSESGYDKNFPEIEIYYNSESNNKIIAEAIQEMLKKNLNIDIKLKSHEWAIFNFKRKQLDYNGLAKNSHMFEYFDPISFLKIFSEQTENQSGYQNSNYNIIFNKIVNLSGKQRNEKILEAMEFLENDPPVIPLFFYSNCSLTKPYIRNYCVNSIGYKYFALINISQ